MIKLCNRQTPVYRAAMGPADLRQAPRRVAWKSLLATPRQGGNASTMAPLKPVSSGDVSIYIVRLRRPSVIPSLSSPAVSPIHDSCVA